MIMVSDELLISIVILHVTVFKIVDLFERISGGSCCHYNLPTLSKVYIK